MVEEQKFDRRYANKALLLFAGFAIMSLYIETMLVPSLPSIGKQYGIDAAETSLIISMYLVSGVALNPIVGKLGDIYGKKRVLKFILPIYVIAVGVTGFSPNFTFLLVSRTIQGVGLTLFPLLISLIQEEFPKEMVPRSLAIIVAMFSVGAAIGLPIGSFISNSFGWQVTYHTAFPFVLVIAILMLINIRESRYTRPEVKIDYVGAIGLAASLAMIVFALSEGTAYGWTSAPILFLIIGGIIIMAALLFYEKRVPEPILNSKLLSIKNVLCSNILVFFAGLGMFFSYQMFAYLFESQSPLGFGYTIFQTGLAIVPFSIMSILMAPIAGRYIPRLGVKPFFTGGAILAIIGFAFAAIYISDPTLTIIGEAIIGAGLAIVNIPTINLLVLSIEQRDMGLATSLNSVFRFSGSALGAPIAGLLIATYASRMSFVYGFYLGIICMIFVLVVAFFSDEILGKNKKMQKLEAQVSV